MLAEVGLRGLSKTIDGETAALAEVDFVGVEFKYFLLVEAMLELEGDDDLDDLALDAFFRREKETARQLHGERGTALLFLAGGYVAIDGFNEPPLIDAAVFEEAAVFDGQHGLHEIGRDFVVGDEAA